MLRPTLDVRLFSAPNAEWTTRALIDTGSPLTLFDRAAADALLVRIGAAGAETREIAMLGKTRRVQLEHIDLSLKDLPYSWSARVGFIIDPSFQMVFQGVLGTEGFLDKWAVTFNYYYNYFELHRPDEAYTNS
ncbi:MAG TPA: hypothetical protein VGD11_09435 [Mycobacteriales bacterium]